ncbi:MAG: spore cortex biosynthesis protein YabQ [Clostridia bacterium]|nr:spore cortex biosynthesis protein YabQ [Clostridia bacterium]
MISLTWQVQAFLITIAIGLLMGLTFDVYRLVLKHFRWRRWGRDIGDFIFWLIVTLMVFLLLLHGNWGEVRLYVLLGLGIGLGIYFRMFTRLTRRIIKTLARLIKKTLLFLLMIISFPFRLVQKIIIVPLGFIGLGFTRAARWVRPKARLNLIRLKRYWPIFPKRKPKE